MDKIAVVILNYNGKRFLKEFLPTVISKSPEARIYVADNCSTDDSVSFLKENFPNIQLIINSANGGFAKGYNDALKKIDAEYYVLLNSDIEVTENWISPCINLLELNPEIAAVQPKVLSYNNKVKFEHAGAAGGFLDKDFYPFCQGRIFETTEVDNGQYNESKEVFWATGACLFIRSKAYHSVNGLDEDFFAHMEEIDLCWRLKSRGHKIYYCAESSIYHVGGGTLNYANPKKTYLNFRNSLYMMTKNYGGILFIKLFKRLVLDGMAATLFILKFQFKHFGAVFMSHMTYYKNLRTFLRKRNEEKKVNRVKVTTGLYKRSIVLRSFLFGKKSFKDLNPNNFK
ncbi:glycosyltransferase family 2 protein [Crocinitomix algicola]|uniref:glycosyltransferase family 2 protein n=1 Tax=Crocinitomix algicola TaxID=1740263 RepID=UPI000829DA89|nr:glycosyltransferase family 2 protein [Crocinitomix algicola]